jgi:tRNA pseudouridine38-40 synthase
VSLCLRGKDAVTRTIKLTLAYDGTDFAGWQVQPRERTLQGTLEEVLAKITGEQIRVFASGRTDAGVHALAQVVSFDTATAHTAAVLHKALNAELPHDISALTVEEMPDRFHARRLAKRKRYRYFIVEGRVRDVFRRRYAWHVYRRLDFDAMREAANTLVGTHDFASFQSAGSKRETTERTVFELTLNRLPDPDPNVLQLDIEADGFLYNMVRNIVGTLLEVGQGVQSPVWVAEVLAAKDRQRAGCTAPPQGLFLVEVKY